MGKRLIAILAFSAVIYHSNDAHSFNSDLFKAYHDLFTILSSKIVVPKTELENFGNLISDYIVQSKDDFGRSALNFSSNIAMVNGSLVIGYTTGKGRNLVSSSDILVIRNQYNNLYLPLYSYAIPHRMIDKYPKYVLDHNIIPAYEKIVNFKNVKDFYLKILDLSRIPENGKLYMVKSITGFATGIALADNRKLLKRDDIDKAISISCDYYPKCGPMLAQNLAQFSMMYRTVIQKAYFGP
jgi:hypothetical protein